MNELLPVFAEFGLYWVARLLLPVLSLGRVSVQTLDSRETGFNRFGVKRLAKGRVLVRRRVAALIGCAFWLVAVCGFLVVRTS